MSTTTNRAETRASRGGPLALAALGVVFGDIGTSPLYTFKTVLALTGGQPIPEVILGALSLIIWTLIVITTVKYVIIAMSMDNDREGGILALMSLLAKKHKRPLIVTLGLFGAALIYGDGAITPAISVLSAIEGLDIAIPALHTYVLPAAVGVLLLLFAIQPLGTARIGRAFGPIMGLWFLSIALLGIWGIARNPVVLVSLNPLLGLHYLFNHGFQGFLVLGGVFLCVTGAEALYADMGHFGSRPIRLSWSLVVFPSLVLNYAGQAAIVLGGAPITHNIFFRLCPPALLIPLIVLSTLATIIASQSIITGAFSMTRQAILLGWMPRLSIKQTSAEGYGQIYVGAVNWTLAAATIGLTLFFGKSDNLAAAYGIAVSLTMLMTSFLLFMAMRDIWGWSLLRSGAVALVLVCVDAAFFGANAMKVLDGGYVPLLLATAVFTVMVVWHRGAAAVAALASEKLTHVQEFLEQLTANKIPRVPGSAVFLTRTTRDIPPVMAWHVKHNRSLHHSLLVLSVVTQSVPWIAENERLQVTKLAPDFWRATARFGFMEHPDIPALLVQTRAFGCNLELRDVTYYVGHETIVRRTDGKGLAWWEEALYAAMVRNAAHVSEILRLPADAVVEIGRQAAI
ncbi:MAG TPA: KUP/HAK/KT family potassium transporter [Steroidobacteraceae bacterium]|jgi:KUP system potassium uptake protein|nr:KUP/HAK/KT family potassium transporter [Steroidobacteraceae bacterium]